MKNIRPGSLTATHPSYPMIVFWEDPVRVATDILKDYAGARCEASLQELIGLVKSLKNEGPADDRKGWVETNRCKEQI